MILVRKGVAIPCYSTPSLVMVAEFFCFLNVVCKMTVYYNCVKLRVGGNTMLVIGYSDFSADMNKYLETAAVSGLKILPRKKEKNFQLVSENLPK